MRPLRILALALCAVAASALAACLLTEADRLLLPAALIAAVAALLWVRWNNMPDSGIDALEAHMAVGTALGLMAGVALNYCGLWESHALGLTLGPLWGMALATLSVGRRNDNE